jgi:predicted AAA+ superfamily ATPase
MRKRPVFIKRIKKAFKTHPIVAILGPRQCGKTTLAHLYIEKEKLNNSVHIFDLEDPEDLAILENPKTTLESLKDLIVLDEIQRLPEIFPLLRILSDKTKQKFLILGNASRDIIKQSSETLAGQIAYIELTPFSIFEVDDIKNLWLKGGFPKSYLCKSLKESAYWRKQYISTFLERDIPNLEIRISPLALRRFWMMLTHYHGQLFNASEIGKSLKIADTTVRHYLDVLTGTFMIRQLLPWFENIKKRQIKTPKIYFRDSGIYHTLSNITDQYSLLHNPKLGASWEGFALEEIIRIYQVTPEETFFWGIHSQSEIDLLIIKEGKRIGFEFKYKDAPKITNSMKIALEILKLDELQVIYPGKKDYPLAKNIIVKGLKSKITSASKRR